MNVKRVSNEHANSQTERFATNSIQVRQGRKFIVRDGGSILLQRDDNLRTEFILSIWMQSELVQDTSHRLSHGVHAADHERASGAAKN